MEKESRINHDGAVYEDEYQYGKKQSHDVLNGLKELSMMGVKWVQARRVHISAKI